MNNCKKKIDNRFMKSIIIIKKLWKLIKLFKIKNYWRSKKNYKKNKNKN